MNIATLTNAATLKGYLLATDAPRAMILLAEQIVEAAMQGLSEKSQPVHSLRNEDAKLPEPSAELVEAIVNASETAPTHNESRFAEPEVVQPEEEDHSSSVHSKYAVDAPVTTGGGIGCKEETRWPVEAGGKHAARN